MCSSSHFSLFSVMKSIMFLLCPNNFNIFRLNITCNIKTAHKNHFFFFCGTPAWSRPRVPCFEFPTSHTIRHTNLEGCPEWMNMLSQRPLPTQHTTNTRDKHPCPQHDSNLWFHNSDSHRLCASDCMVTRISCVYLI
jgi:hypothetical protein